MIDSDTPYGVNDIISIILQATSLSDFYEVCRGLDLARNFQFPVLREVLGL